MNRNDNIYGLLRQDGPFATGDNPPGQRNFSSVTRQRVQSLRAAGLLTKYRVMRNLVMEFLQVESLGSVQALLNDQALREKIGRRAYLLIGNMFGIEGSEREIIARVNSYSQTADGVIRYLKSNVFSRYASHIEMTNEIDATNSPVDLLLILFDRRYHKKARFEAKRKLILMQLAASIDQRERETCISDKFARFLDFLNRYVWSEDVLIGELEAVFLYSQHEPENFVCTDVKVLSIDEAAQISCQAGRKLTLIKRRRFRLNGREVPIYVSIRKKSSEAKVLKLLRKGEENPAVAVDDELGLMGVVDSVMDVKLFQKHLTRSAIRANSFMTLEEVSDTLAGGRHESSSPGSSASTTMLKFFARMGGMRVEFIVHTHKSYLDYRYQRDVAHDEYEVRRIFDSGVAELLFPYEIYYLNMDKVKVDLIRVFRRRIEEL